MHFNHVSQALTFMTHEKMHASICEVNIEQQLRKGVEWVEEGVRHDARAPRAFLVSTCMGRYHQLRIAMLYNLCILWPFRHQFTVCLMFWNEDRDAIDEFANDAAFFVDHGFLRIASAGKLGMHLSETWPCPAHDGAFPRHSLPQPGLRGHHLQDTWHSPICKNAVHQFAKEIANDPGNAERLFYVSLDCDNLLTRGFGNVLLEWMNGVADRGSEVVAPMLVRGEHLDSGTCGRMAYRFCDFDAVRGYDQDFYPVGYQDVDLKVRFKEMQKRAGQKNTKHIDNVANFGGAVPNDPTSRRHDRNSAKITEVAGNILGSEGTSSWGKMNAKNLEMAHQKMQRGEIIRNQSFDLERERLGCWWRPITQAELKERRAAQAELPVGAHPSFSIAENQAAFQPASRGRGSVPPLERPRPTRASWMAPSLVQAALSSSATTPSKPAVVVRVATAGLARPPCDTGHIARTALRVVVLRGAARSVAYVMLFFRACGKCACACVCTCARVVATGDGWRTSWLRKFPSTTTLFEASSGSRLGQQIA